MTDFKSEWKTVQPTHKLYSRVEDFTADWQNLQPNGTFYSRLTHFRGEWKTLQPTDRLRVKYLTADLQTLQRSGRFNSRMTADLNSWPLQLTLKLNGRSYSRMTDFTADLHIFTLEWQTLQLAGLQRLQPSDRIYSPVKNNTAERQTLQPTDSIYSRVILKPSGRFYSRVTYFTHVFIQNYEVNNIAVKESSPSALTMTLTHWHWKYLPVKPLMQTDYQ